MFAIAHAMILKKRNWFEEQVFCGFQNQELWEIKFGLYWC